MIISFRHKGLQELFKEGATHRLPQDKIKKIDKLLWVLNEAGDLRDLNRPGLRLHRLKKPPYDGFYSIDVSGNYRIVFLFYDGQVSECDYLDTH